MAVAALVDPKHIKRSWAVYRSGAGLPTSLWTCWIVTSSALAQIEVEFDSGMYEEHEEGDRNRRQAQLPMATLKQAWKRPLANVTELRVGSLPYNDVRLKFADKDIHLPGRPPGSVEGETERFDHFIEAVFAAIPF